MLDLKRIQSITIWKRFLLQFLTLFILISGAAWYVHTVEKETRLKLFHQQEEVCVENHHQRIMDKLQVVKSDLLFLSQLEELNETISSLEEPQRLSLAKEFLTFSATRGIYDQIRFVDLQGMEQIRINYNNGSPAIVSKEKLQQKAKRYYFSDILKLKKGEIYVSPFDLNIEHGKIEKPYKPMLRFSTQVFDKQGERRGVIILNYLGVNILAMLKEELQCDHGCQIILLNRDGYWLRGKDPAKEWAFMFAGKERESFAHDNPAEWQRIKSSNNGDFIAAKGFITFGTIYPLHKHDVSSQGNPQPYARSLGPLAQEEYFWKIVTIIPRATLNLPRSYYFSFFATYLAATLLSVFITFCCAYLQARRREAESGLQNIFDSSIPICITNKDSDIVLTNDSYKEIFALHEQTRPKLKCYESRPGPACHTDKCPLTRVLAGEKDVVCEPSKMNEDGSSQHFIVTARPYVDNHGQIVGIVESFQDITDRKNIELERDKLVEELQSALAKVKVLSGFLPICASCKKIRDDKGYWNQIESYIRDHSEAEFSHSICPECSRKIYPEIFEENDLD